MPIQKMTKKAQEFLAALPAGSQTLTVLVPPVSFTCVLPNLLGAVRAHNRLELSALHLNSLLKDLLQP